MAPAPAERPPNILLLFPDQWRWDWLGCVTSPYGKVPVRTPQLDALAARGVCFTQCRTNAPLCAPARACLATGMRYESCGVPSNGYDLDTRAPTFFRALRDAGYRVAATGKTDLQKHGRWKGLDGWTAALGRLGFSTAVNQCGKWDAVNTGAAAAHDPYMAHLHGAGLAAALAQDMARRRAAGAAIDTAPTPLPRAHYTDDFCGARAADYLRAWGPGEPWLLWVNFPGPHEPYDPPVQLRQRYDGVAFPPPVHCSSTDPADVQQVRRNYAAMIEGIDEWIGRLLGLVEQRGETDHTLVLFCSDHGEMLGDHGRWHKSVPWEGSVHVPLIAAGAGVTRRGTSHGLVELIDLAATCLDAAGVPPLPGWDARSVTPLLAEGADDAAHRTVQVAALHDWRMVCDGRHKLVDTRGHPPRLYDLAADPTEGEDVAAAQPQVVARLQAHLATKGA